MPDWAIAIVSIAATLAVIVGFSLASRFTLSSATLTIPGVVNFTFEPSRRERDVAWALYIELRTRKAALPFDPDNDLIVEVYDSLHEIFPRIRSLLDRIPPREPEFDLAELILRVQNDMIRPHLTHWQARFRRWYEHEVSLAANAGRDPIEIQRRFSDYDVLVRDVQRMNRDLDLIAASLLEIATPVEPYLRRAVRRIPVVRRLVERRPKPVAPSSDG